MNQQIQGVVEKYAEYPRNWTDKKTGQPRSGKAYSVTVNGVQFGSFNEPLPGAHEGAQVQFTASQNGQYWNIVKNSFVVLGQGQAAPAAAPQPAAPAPVAAPAPQAAPAPAPMAPTSREVSIEWQSARNAALTKVQTLVTAGALELPAGKGKVGDKLAVVEGAIEAYTLEFYYDLQEIKENGPRQQSVEGFMDGFEDDEADAGV